MLVDPRVWRGRRTADAAHGVPSRCAALDALLPEGGFPATALTEVYAPIVGSGELSLLLPALAALGRRGALAFVAPPHIPYAPALAAVGVEPSRAIVVRAVGARELCWAMEQALRDGACGAVVAWSGEQTIAFAALRRLQLAAEAGATPGFLFRPWAARRCASPAALRLTLEPVAGASRITVLKCRGRAGRFAVAAPAHPMVRDVASPPAPQDQAR